MAEGCPHSNLQTTPDGRRGALAANVSIPSASHIDGTLKAPRAPHEKSQRAALPFDSSGHSWLGAIALAVAIGIAYFLAARLGLALRAKEGVAIFWPAAGIAVGALVALGPRVRLPVAAGVVSRNHRYPTS